MKNKLKLLLSLSLISSFVNADHHESIDTKKLNKELDNVLNIWTEAFNNQNVEKLISLYHQKTDVIYENGIQNRGRKGMEVYFINQFKSSPEVKETITNVERRYLNSSMVIESGMWHRKGVLDPTSPTVGRYSCTLIKQNDKWQIIHDRAWSLPDKDSNGSKLKSNDNLSKNIIRYFNSAFNGEYEIAEELLSDDVSVSVNDIKVDGKKNYLKRLKIIQTELFDNVKFEGLHVHTNYYSKKGHSSGGKTWGEVRSSPTIWTNAWTKVTALGRNTGNEIKFRMHAAFRWEKNQVVEMLYLYDPKQYDLELSKN